MTDPGDRRQIRIALLLWTAVNLAAAVVLPAVYAVLRLVTDRIFAVGSTPEAVVVGLLATAALVLIASLPLLRRLKRWKASRERWIDHAAFPVLVALGVMVYCAAAIFAVKGVLLSFNQALGREYFGAGDISRSLPLFILYIPSATILVLPAILHNRLQRRV